MLKPSVIVRGPAGLGSARPRNRRQLQQPLASPETPLQELPSLTLCSALLSPRSPWLLLAPLLSPAVPHVSSPPCCLCPDGVHRFQWIRNLVPEFGVSSSHVRVLSSPAEFFELMKASGA